MRINTSSFLSFRYLLASISGQVNCDQFISNKKGVTKEILMRDIFETIYNDKKTEWTIGNKRYLFYSFQKYNDIFIIKYARESSEEIFVEGDDDLRKEEITEAKYIFLIIDTKHQIILFEKKISAFSSINNCVNTFAKFLCSRMKKFNYLVNIDPLVSQKDFWDHVDSADKIYSLSLKMNAPNMAFFGNEDTGNVLKEIKEATNNQNLEIEIQNSEGKLKILRESIGNWINYVQEVAGRYKLVHQGLNSVTLLTAVRQMSTCRALLYFC